MTADPIPAFDEGIVRQAMLRGAVRTGLVAALALTMLALLVGGASAVVGVVRGDHFFLVAYNGTVAAHPEYEVEQDGSCCATGPLFGFTNLGLASEITLKVRPVGALNYAGTSTVTVEQDAFGDLSTTFDSARTPLGDGLRRGRPTKESTAAFLASLPAATVVSALIELDRPVTSAEFDEFFATTVPVEAVADRGVPVIVVPPYASGSGNPIGWPSSDLLGLRAWADRLGGIDEQHLSAVGLPPASEVQRVAEEGRIHAFVLPRLPASLLATLLANGSVVSANVLDVAFDPDRQVVR